MVGVVTPWELANAINVSLFSGELVVEHLPAHFQTVQGYFIEVAEEPANA